VLLAFGYAPVTANVYNTIGLVPGAVSGAVGYRRELVGQRQRRRRRLLVFAAHVAWAPAAIIAVSSIVGGQLGAHYGRRLPGASDRGA